MAVLGKQQRKDAEDPLLWPCQDQTLLVCERRAGVFCTSCEDDFSSVLGSQPCPMAVPAVPVVAAAGWPS